MKLAGFLLLCSALPFVHDDDVARYIIHFRERSFDLSAYRHAILASRPAGEVAEIIAGYERRVREDQAELAARVRALDGRVVAQWWLINACAVEVPAASVERLEKLPGIDFIEPDRVMAPMAPIKTATNLKHHAADALQAIKVTGKGVTAAIIDTGQDSDTGGLKRTS